MKRMMFIAAAFAALVCCSKSETTQNPPTEPGTEDTPAVVEYAFTEGETVTITAGASLTKVSSALNDNNGVDFKWESDDTIKVTVGEKSSVFKVSKLKDGGVNAEFTGKMPASGDAFDVQYPVEDPVLTSQTYSSTEAIPHDAMKFTATGCTVEEPFELTARYAALRLNLWGGARSVRQIVVTGPTPACTLTFETPKVVGKDKDNATPFFIVMPAGNYSFTVDVDAVKLTPSADNTVSYETYGIGTPLSSSTSFSTSTEKEFKPNEVLNMSARSLTTVWAPVNCGYDATHTYGLLYQWGRKVGGGYDATEGMQTATAATYDDDGYYKELDDNRFYTQDSTYPADWYTNISSQQLSAWPMTSSVAGYVEGKIANPCPSGWRVPTVDELGNLCYTDWNSSSKSGNTRRGSWDGTNKGWNFDTLFLPAAGYRDCFSGDADDRGVNGNYWSSSVQGNIAAWYLDFRSGSAYVSYVNRSYGSSVRCVQE